MFSVHTKAGVFKFPHFRDGLVWTEGLIGEIKLRFQIPPGYCGRGIRWLTDGFVCVAPSNGLKNFVMIFSKFPETNGTVFSEDFFARILCISEIHQFSEFRGALYR